MLGRWILASLALFCASAQAQRFSVEFRVSKIPSTAEFVPVTRAVNFKELGVDGLVDERSLRLFQIARGSRKEIPYQFSATPQPRASRRLLTNTPPSVSYLAEFAAGEKSDAINVAGELTWVTAGTNSVYELEFEAPTTGRQIQTPFPPQSLRAFDDVGRARGIVWFPKMQLHPQWPFEGVVHFREGRELVTTYHLGPSLTNLTSSVRRPFFYPVVGPDGVELTEFGKPHDPTGSHAHHYSLWITHHDVNGKSFWGERAGVIAHEALDLMEDGPIFSRIVQRARWNSEGADILKETRRITLFESGVDFRALDIEMELTPATNRPVIFGKTSFGFLAARVTQSMTPFDGGGEIRTAAGKLNEAGAHLTRAAWLDQSGPIAQDKWGGIAVLDHPSNPRFPSGWHCRNDGWAGAAFTMDEPFTLDPKQTLRLKYRVILHRHNAERGRIARRFEEWASEPEIKLGALKRL